MLRRHILAAAGATLGAPAIVSRGALGQNLRKVKMGSAFTTTTNAAFLMPALLKPEGIDLELVMFPSLVQRMQAVASGDVDIGNGGLSATMQVATKGFPMQVLANGCDGGWMVLAQPAIKSFQDLKGKKVAVQNGSIGLVSLNWKLKQERVFGQVEMAFMDNQDQPVPLMRGDVAAICVFEPYAALAELNGWGKRLWVPYNSPMGKTNLGFVASSAFVKKDPELTKKMVAAHVKATNEMATNPSIAIETTIKQFKMTKEVAELSTKNLFFSADFGHGLRRRPQGAGQDDDGRQDAGEGARLGGVPQSRLRLMQWRRAWGLLPLALLLLVWELAVQAKVYPTILLPPPGKVLMVFVDDWQVVLSNAAASIGRVTVGITLSFLFAVPLGLMIGRYRLLDTMTDWSIQIFRSIPPIALIPLALLFLGIGDKPAIALIFLAGTWPLLINTIFGVRNIERTLIKVARAARASEFLVMKDIILPAALPAIFTGLRLAVGGGWLTVVTAEMIAVKSGLGYMILNAQLTFRSDLIIAGIIVIGAIGLLADQAVRRVRAHVCRWQEGLTASPE